MPGVQAHAVVAAAHRGQLAFKAAGIGEPRQVRPLVLEVAEEALDGRLVGRDAGASEVRGDRVQRHELGRRARRHLGAVVGDREQDRLIGVGRCGVGEPLGAADDAVEQPL